MTQVDFYTQADDRLRIVAQLCAKAVARQVRVLCLARDAAMSERLSRVLWSAPPNGFLPHCRAADRLAARTPILVDHVTDVLPHHELLINLCADAPAVFSRFERLIEIVGNEPDDRDQARERYRFYRDRGYEIRTHKLTSVEA
jgi:DNA polymerase-3 subunit chi